MDRDHYLSDVYRLLLSIDRPVSFSSLLANILFLEHALLEGLHRFLSNDITNFFLDNTSLSYTVGHQTRINIASRDYHVNTDRTRNLGSTIPCHIRAATILTRNSYC